MQAFQICLTSEIQNDTPYCKYMNKPLPAMIVPGKDEFCFVENNSAVNFTAVINGSRRMVSMKSLTFS